MDIAKSKILHDRELALLGKDDVLDDNVGAFSELSQNHLELAITRDFAARAQEEAASPC